MKRKRSHDTLDKLYDTQLHSILITSGFNPKSSNHILHVDDESTIQLLKRISTMPYIRGLSFLSVPINTAKRDLMPHILNLLNTSNSLTSIYIVCSDDQTALINTAIMRNGSNIIRYRETCSPPELNDRLQSVASLAIKWMHYKEFNKCKMLNIPSICMYRHALKSIFNYMQELPTLSLDLTHTTDWSMFDQPAFAKTLDQDLLPLCKDHLYKCMLLMHLCDFKDIVLHITFQHMDYALVSQTMKQIEAETSRTL